MRTVYFHVDTYTCTENSTEIGAARPADTRIMHTQLQKPTARSHERNPSAMNLCTRTDTQKAHRCIKGIPAATVHADMI
eukprot:19594-Eustigmatos_ZCMA.PRE.1